MKLLKNMLGVIFYYQNHYKGLINIKNKDNYCFIWSYIRYLNPQLKDPNRIKLTDKKIFDEIYQKLINFKFPLEINKTNIKKIEDILKINICILTADDKENVYTMFTSENNNPNDLNLFYYMNHICLIKDINKYLEIIEIKTKNTFV